MDVSADHIPTASMKNTMMSMNIHMYNTCVYVCVYIHVCICMYMHVCMHVCMMYCVCMFVYVHVCVRFTEK